MASFEVSLVHYFGLALYKRLTNNRSPPEGDRLGPSWELGLCFWDADARFWFPLRRSKNGLD
jgi:hypothetical protein